MASARAELIDNKPLGKPSYSPCTFLFLAFLLTARPCHSQTADAFNPGIPGSSTQVYGLAAQPDGKILVGGNLLKLAGRAQYFLGRVNADGTPDPGFAPFDNGGSNVTCISVQSDGKILVGGNFKRIGGQSRSYIARLQSDGNLDTAFSASADSVVYTFGVQPDGRILAGGAFTNLNGQTRRFMGRFEGDGSLDTNFNPVLDGAVNTMALQPDGAMIIGGSFSNVNGQAAIRLCRLNPDGSLDTNFVGTVGGTVWTVALQADGKVLVGGGFTTLDGQDQAHLGRLNADGSLDTDFSPAYNRNVSSISLQADGRIILSGISSGEAPSVTNVARLSLDGTVDPTFNPGAVGSIYALALQSDGKLIVGGANFTKLAGQTRTNIARLNNTDAATQSLDFDGSTITWLRGGTSPELTRASFETSTDGTNWFGVGAGTRITGGWQLSGLSFATNVNIRARGIVVGGYGNNCSWPVEMVGGPPWIYAQPASQVVTNGQTAVFSVIAAGTPALAYQWRKNGTNLLGMTGSALAITNAGPANSGSYDVVVSNTMGMVVSSSGALLLASPAKADSFAPNVGGPVQTIAVQPDGKVLVGFNVGPSSGSVWRFNTDGSPDPAFKFGANELVTTVAVQDDLKILIGGHFTTFGGQPRASLWRANPDGSPDASFNPSTDGQVNCLALQADGRIVIGGSFTTVNGEPHTNLARLNINGSLDGTLDVGADRPVYCLALQADNAILVGGSFGSLGGQSRIGLARLLPGGSLDGAFNPGGATVYAMAVQADGRIVVGGNFSYLGGQPRAGIGRINSDGTLDTTFSPGAGANIFGDFNTLAVQTDGRILVGGSFQYSVPTPGGLSVDYLCRLNSDGTFDLTFRPPVGDRVQCVALQPDGKALVGGRQYLLLGAQGRHYLGRLNSTYPAIHALGRTGSTLTWLRGGTGPEFWRVAFDVSTNGVDWSNVASGTRIPAGWTMDASDIPPGATVRARGFITGSGISGYFVEDWLFQRSLAILAGDGDFGIRAGRFGFNVTGSPSQSAVIEASTNLATWTALYTNTFGGSPLYFSDPSWTNSPAQYYRLRSL
jgi:uncharacterized delta-60 repeat protein